MILFILGAFATGLALGLAWPSIKGWAVRWTERRRVLPEGWEYMPCGSVACRYERDYVLHACDNGDWCVDSLAAYDPFGDVERFEEDGNVTQRRLFGPARLSLACVAADEALVSYRAKEAKDA